MRLKSIIKIFLIISASAFTICAEEKLHIYVSILPQKYFAEKIGGDLITVKTLVPPGKNPAMFSPSPAVMSRLSKAKVFFRIGVPYENHLLPKIKSTAPSIKIVDTRKGVRLRTMTGHNHADRHHDENMDGKDPHIWLDPNLVKIQAGTMHDALCEIDSEHCGMYSANLLQFHAELDSLDKTLKSILGPFKDRTMLVFHPSFGYLTDEYGLKQMAVEMEGKAPKGSYLTKLIKTARKEKIKAVFVQSQFNNTAVLKIASAINGEVFTLDPLSENYSTNMIKMAETIRDGLEHE